VLASLARADRVYLSVFVLGELYAGFKSGSRETENKKILERFLDKPDVAFLEAGLQTAEYFALVKSSLRKSGKPIPLYDVWIAAHALETGSALVTYDVHFLSVPGLRIWDGMAKEG
jgi:tRNA(fMet)-specific endonuclease VapC